MTSNGAVLIMDGTCNFCWSWIGWFERRLDTWPTTLPWQRADLAAPGLSSDECQRAMQLVRPGSRTLSGHRALAEILRAQRSGGWQLAGRLLTAPGIDMLAGALYAWIASNRRRLRWLTPP